MLSDMSEWFVFNDSNSITAPVPPMWLPVHWFLMKMREGEQMYFHLLFMCVYHSKR